MTSCATSKTKWNAADYAANSAVQQSWARELISRLKLRGDERVLDVGCGDGKVTAELARAVPKGFVMGVDASLEMVQFALNAFPPATHRNLEFRVCDARKLAIETERLPPARRVGRDVESPGGPEAGAPFDLVFSNAALHWVDDHKTFLLGAAALLKPGGRLIVSCGGKGNAHDVFLALRPEMRLMRWRRFFRRMPKPYYFYSPEEYGRWLPLYGFQSCRIELAPKDAVYDGEQGFAAWLRTTWLPYVQRVPEDSREDFIAAVTQRYLAKHPPDVNGGIHVRMVRLEIEAIKTETASGAQ